MAGPTDTGGATGTDAAPATDSGLGQASATDTGLDSGATATAPAHDAGDSTGATSGATEPTFFDPSGLSEDLVPAYKQMQGDYTRKLQEIAKSRDKIRAYDAALNDPRGTIEMLARQYEIPVNFGQAQSNGAGTVGAEEWNPQDWNEVIERAGNAGYERAMAELRPFVANTRKSQLERDLDGAFPEWRQYEDRFAQTLQDHPTLATDAHLLAQAATPREVLEAKATQVALRKLEQRSEGNKSKPSSTTKVPETPQGPMTVQQSYDLAMKQLGGRR